MLLALAVDWFYTRVVPIVGGGCARAITLPRVRDLKDTVAIVELFSCTLVMGIVEELE